MNEFNMSGAEILKELQSVDADNDWDELFGAQSKKQLPKSQLQTACDNFYQQMGTTRKPKKKEVYQLGKPKVYRP